jgi:hypothetical protein
MRPQGASRHTEHFRCSSTPSSSRARTRPRLAAVLSLIGALVREVALLVMVLAASLIVTRGRT